MSLLQQIHAGNGHCVPLAEGSSATFALHAGDRRALSGPFKVVIGELTVGGEVSRRSEFKRREGFHPALTERKPCRPSERRHGRCLEQSRPSIGQ
jgi:hypothetical protein